MSTITASTQVTFGTQEDGILDVIADEWHEGDAPLVVRLPIGGMPQVSDRWEPVDSVDILKMGFDEFVPLSIMSPGIKRIKLFCPISMVPGLAFVVDNGKSTTKIPMKLSGVEGVWPVDVNTASIVGRRATTLTEILTWNGVTTAWLKYPYDRPVVKIIAQTDFYNKFGDKIAPPRYHQGAGEFRCDDEAYGWIQVEYEQQYTLVEAIYDNGVQLASPTHFTAMRQAWLRGTIKSVWVPPVRLFVRSSRKAVAVTFERLFWPEGVPGLQITWPKDKEKDEKKNKKEEYREMPGTRETTTTRVYDKYSINYVDVEWPTYFEAESDGGDVLRLRMLK